MCYNKNVSLITFVILVASAIFLIWRNYENDRWFSIFFILAGIMQLLEYFMWIDPQCGRINHWASVFAVILLLLQPIGIILGGYFLGKFKFDKRKLLPIVIFYCILFGLAIIFNLIKSRKVKLCSIAKCKHLNWDLKIIDNWFFKGVLFIFYFLSFILIFISYPRNYGISLGSMYLITLFLSVMISKNSTWKSLWCWMVNFIPIIYIIITYSLMKKIDKNSNNLSTK